MPRPGEPGWAPKLVALDIDGTLLAWVDGADQTYEKVSPAVYEAVHAAKAAGAHIVLASGRSPHAMAPIAELLDLHPAEGDDKLWMAGSNGAVIFRWPPVEVEREETFDARDAVAAILRHNPRTLVAVEERDLGYRVNRHFPEGELTGEIIETSVEEMVADPVSRVIIRDPDATVADFEEMVAQLGLHGTEYVIGWSAWLDLTPTGVSKASALDYICKHLNLSAEDALAIGDGTNDLDMLRWAGRGVAMGQASDRVNETADAATGDVFTDGAAIELQRWF